MIKTEIRDLGTKKRIRKIIEKRGGNASKFARELGILPNYLVSVLNGNDKGISSMMLKCFSKIGININWLLDGKGDMYIENEKTFKDLSRSLKIAQNKILKLENDLEKANYLAIELKKMIIEGK